MVQVASYTTFLALVLSAVQVAHAITLPAAANLVYRRVHPLPRSPRQAPRRALLVPGLRGDARQRRRVDCNNYLVSLGTKACTVSRGGTIMCHSGRTIVKGFAVGDSDTASSYCRDVATGVKWVLDNCPACPGNDCNIAGYQAAGGNGNLLVKVSGA